MLFVTEVVENISTAMRSREFDSVLPVLGSLQLQGEFMGLECLLSPTSSTKNLQQIRSTLVGPTKQDRPNGEVDFAS